MKVIKNYFLPLVRAANQEWPEPDWPYWHLYSNEDSVKRASKDPCRLTPSCKLLLAKMAEHPVDDGLFPDMALHGAGMHEIPEGGHLSLHKDSERHPAKPWFRKLNMVLFLSECEGGELEIEGQSLIIPEPGKAVVFSPGLSHQVLPVTAGSRRSLSLFWWGLDGDGDTTSARFS